MNPAKRCRFNAPSMADRRYSTRSQTSRFCSICTIWTKRERGRSDFSTVSIDIWYACVYISIRLWNYSIERIRKENKFVWFWGGGRCFLLGNEMIWPKVTMTDIRFALQISKIAPPLPPPPPSIYEKTRTRIALDFSTVSIDI